MTHSREHPAALFPCLAILKFVFFWFLRESYLIFTNRRMKANTATTTTVTPLRPTTANQITTPQLAPQPVLIPLPTTHHTSQSPEATFRSTQYSLLHLPLTEIPFLIPSPLHFRCTTRPQLIRPSTVTLTLVSGTRTTCPYGAHHLHAHKSQRI